MHYIFYTDGQLQGEPFTLPHRTATGGVIGKNTPIDILREYYGVIPCDYITVDQPANERLEVNADGTSATQFEVPQPDPHEEAVNECKAEAGRIEAKHSVSLPADWKQAKTMLDTSTDLKADGLVLKIMCNDLGVNWNEITGGA